MNSCRTLQEICTPERDAGWDSSQAFYKRFSGLVRALPPEPAGADAWRATTYGHGVLQTNPLGSALDQESPGSIPGGATRSAISRSVVSRFDRFGPSFRAGQESSVRATDRIVGAT